MATERGSSLFRMLADLSEDQKELDDFRSNPERVMDRYGLSQEQQELVLSGWRDRGAHNFLKAIGDEALNYFDDIC